MKERKNLGFWIRALLRELRVANRLRQKSAKQLSRTMSAVAVFETAACKEQDSSLAFRISGLKSGRS